MLRELAGKNHQVITGVAVHETGKSTLLEAETTTVQLHKLSDEEIQEYVATGEPLDKAGSYGAQGLGGKLIEKVDGDFFNVVGLPAARLLEMLSAFMDVETFRIKLAELDSKTFVAGNL